MNPPFHNGKKTDCAIGNAFIETALQALRPGGQLFMVANNHLPYEEALADKFYECIKLHEGQGFKVFHARK